MFPEDVGGPMITVEVLVAHEGLGITASGTPDARTYVYSADVITVSEGNIGNDRGDPPPTIDMEIIARDLATTYLSRARRRRNSASKAVAASGIAGRFDVFPPPGEDGRLKASFALGEMKSTASGTIVALAAMQQTTDGCPKGSRSTARPTMRGPGSRCPSKRPSDAFNLYYANDGGNFGIALVECGAALRHRGHRHGDPRLRQRDPRPGRSLRRVERIVPDRAAGRIAGRRRMPAFACPTAISPSAKRSGA
jgi:hypothetical protein